MFEPTDNLPPRYFAGCGSCQSCCDGSQFLMMPLILEDFAHVARYFPILFGYIDTELRALMLISRGTSPCPYLSSFGCRIYTDRPPGCRIYPLTPFDDKILVDTACHAVGDAGLPLCRPQQAEAAFDHPRLHGFFPKLTRTREYLQTLHGRLSPRLQVAGIELFQADSPSDEWLELHLNSLRHLALMG